MYCRPEFYELVIITYLLAAMLSRIELISMEDSLSM